MRGKVGDGEGKSRPVAASQAAPGLPTQSVWNRANDPAVPEGEDDLVSESGDGFGVSFVRSFRANGEGHDDPR